MKEQLQDKLVEVLTAMQVAAGQAKDFTLAQLPDIAQSYVVYGRIVAVLTVFGWATVLTAALLVARWFWKNPSYSTYSWDHDKKIRSGDSWFALGVCGVIGGVFFFGLYLSLTSGALVWFAPKVWLLKEIAGMLK